MFGMVVGPGGVIIKKTSPGWSESALKKTLAPLILTIFLPKLEEKGVVQQDSDSLSQHRSRRQDGSQETFTFDSKDRYWRRHELRTFRFFGELEYLRRIQFNDYRPVDGWSKHFPHAVEVDDEKNGYKARITVRTVTVR